jgi:hypothetical protein
MKEAIGFLNWAYGKYFRKYINNKAVWLEDKYNDLADYDLFDKPHFTGEELFTEYLEWQKKVDARANEKPFS